MGGLDLNKLAHFILVVLGIGLFVAFGYHINAQGLPQNFIDNLDDAILGETLELRVDNCFLLAVELERPPGDFSIDEVKLVIERIVRLGETNQHGSF